MRFARSLGLFVLGVPTQNMHMCTSRSGADGKGPCARKCRLTHMVDDHLECLWSVFEDPCGNVNGCITENNCFLVHFTQNEREGGSWLTRAIRPRRHVTHDLSQIARWLHCYPGDAHWGWISLMWL